jgi:plasmid maintenance system antidote protein VapI
MDALARRIRKKGLPEVAALMGVSRAHLTNILAGRRRLTPEHVLCLEGLFPKIRASQWWSWVRSSAATVGHDAAHMEGANVAPSSVNDAEAA